MLRIRLARTGKKKQASYRVVVADQRRAVQAKFVEILGWYNPHTKELHIDQEKTKGWLEKGANPSNTVAVLLEKNKLELPSWVKIVQKNKPKKKASEAKTVKEAASNAVPEEKQEEKEAVEEAKEAKVEEEQEAENTEETQEESKTEEPEAEVKEAS